MNYITETFTYVRLAVLAGWSWFQDLLDALGFPWATYLAVLIGFAVVGYVVTIAMSYFRGTDSADSIVSRGMGAYHRNEAHNEREALYEQRRMQIQAYKDRTEYFKNRFGRRR